MSIQSKPKAKEVPKGEETLGTSKRESVIDYRKQGHTVREAAEHFGISQDMVKWYTRGENIGAKKWHDEEKRIEEIKSIISKTLPQYEFESTYMLPKNSSRRVVLRCKECGRVLERSWSAVAKGQVACDCEREKAQAKREEAKAEIRKENARKREQMILWKSIHKSLIKTYEKLLESERRRHACPVCGKVTENPIYCSEACRNKAQNKRAEIKRRHKIKALMVDKDITLEGLIKRDGCICHICGWPCDTKDFQKKGKTIVCGDMYPSIDHVKPLAQGGLHSWENVKLAHRLCNSYKGAM